MYAGESCVNAAMVEEGFAWHYVAYSNSKVLAKTETDARAAKAGLWADPAPTSPWEWRRKPAGEKQGKGETDSVTQLSQAT